MSEFRYEREMQQPVISWLESHGLVSTRELCNPSYNPMDVVAGRFMERVDRRIPPLLETVAVELKLSAIKEVLSQAAHNRRCVDRSYAAMPASRCARMRDQTRLAFLIEGVGLLAVTPDSVVEILPARQSAAGTHNQIKRNLWRKCRKEKKVN